MWGHRSQTSGSTRHWCVKYLHQEMDVSENGVYPQNSCFDIGKMVIYEWI